MKLDKKKRIGVLYSDCIISAACTESIEKAVRIIASQKYIDTELVEINADSPSSLKVLDNNGRNIDVLVNALGPYYPEGKLPEILQYYRNGGTILNIGIKPFSVPYEVIDGTVCFHGEFNGAIRSFEVLDEYVPTGAMKNNMNFRLMDPRYGFLKSLYDNGEFPYMKETYGAYYHLAYNKKEDTKWPDEVGIVEGRLDTICGWTDGAGRLLSVPVTRVEHIRYGTMVFMNFIPENCDYYNTEPGIKLLAEMIFKELLPHANLKVSSKYARYTENETPELDISVKFKHSGYVKPHGYNLKCRIYNSGNSLINEFDFKDLSPGDDIYSATIRLEDLEEDLYRAETYIFFGGECIDLNTTGFYKISDHAISKTLQHIKPMEVDTTKSTDFCVVDGKVFPIHGTTYFTTDVFRDCFVKMNAYLCDKEMQEIKSTGFNLIRTGIWQNFLDFYDDEGNIREVSKRALDAFFYTAARHNIYVQFVLGAYVFNPWDREKCPIHNPEARKKTIASFASFAKRYAHWPNVSVDAINEPSYSIAGRWTLARPSGDYYERLNWIGWLKRKYNNNINLLRATWGVSSAEIQSFEDVDVPDMAQFSRNYDRKDIYRNYPSLTDFFNFARKYYSKWVADIREAVKKENPAMLFMMGRDETLRIPSQQYEAYKGNLDIVNWHQWHQDSAIFAEYFLNRVRGLPCCAQEIGVYHYDDIRGNMRLTERDCSRILERKILYSFGNWVQWQFSSDPNMFENCEISLGLKRQDKSETPHMNIVRILSWVEQKAAMYMDGRKDDKTEILTIHPSSFYYSVDSGLAREASLSSLFVLHYDLKLQSDMVLEHIFQKDNRVQIGNPKLIIIPASQLFSEKAWQFVLDCVKAGTSVLISGCADFDEYGRRTSRFRELGMEATVESVSGVEELKVGKRRFYVKFRKCMGYMNPSKVFNKYVFPGEAGNSVRTFHVGKGKIICCPIPVELGDCSEPVKAVYEYAASVAGVNRNFIGTGKTFENSSLLIYPVFYENSVLYTIVNEGSDTSIDFRDIETGAEIHLAVKGMRGAKIWLDKDGSLLGAYINDRLVVNGRSFVPNGDLGLFKEAGSWNYVLGEREKPEILIDGVLVNVEDMPLYTGQII